MSSKMDLYWLGRRNVAEILSNPRDPGHDPVKKIMNHYGGAAREISDGDQWKHGFNAGALAAMRLVSGLATVFIDDEQFGHRVDDYDGFNETEAKAQMLQEDRDSAVENYPELDS